MGDRASLNETVKSFEPTAWRIAEQGHLQFAPVQGGERVGYPKLDDVYCAG